MLKFISLGSGSSGNSYLLKSDECCILIDAGINARTMKKHFKELGISLEEIDAIFVTHDHADHIKSLGVMSSKANIPVYATRDVHYGITQNYCTSKPIEPAYVRYVEKEETMVLRDFSIIPFEVPHDGTDNVVAVYIDNRSHEGWWYEGAGIYRHVWLEVTETGDLVDYILSLEGMADFRAVTPEELYRVLDEQKKNGVIRVPKDYGMFVSQKEK